MQERTPATPAPASGLLSDRAYAALRDRLISLHVAPGAPIDEDALTRELGVGRTPVSYTHLTLPTN